MQESKTKAFYNSEEFRSFLVSHTYKETAEHFGLTLVAVTSAAKRRGLKAKKAVRKGKRRTFDRGAVADYYLTHTAKKTAEKFGCSINTVVKFGRKSGFVPREEPVEKDIIPAVSKESVLFNLKYYSFDEVAEKFGLKKSEVVKIYMEAGR